MNGSSLCASSGNSSGIMSAPSAPGFSSVHLVSSCSVSPLIAGQSSHMQPQKQLQQQHSMSRASLAAPSSPSLIDALSSGAIEPERQRLKEILANTVHQRQTNVQQHQPNLCSSHPQYCVTTCTDISPIPVCSLSRSPSLPSVASTALLRQQASPASPSSGCAHISGACSPAPSPANSTCVCPGNGPLTIFGTGVLDSPISSSNSAISSPPILMSDRRMSHIAAPLTSIQSPNSTPMSIPTPNPVPSPVSTPLPGSCHATSTQTQVTLSGGASNSLLASPTLAIDTENVFNPRSPNSGYQHQLRFRHQPIYATAQASPLPIVQPNIVIRPTIHPNAPPLSQHQIQQMAPRTLAPSHTGLQNNYMKVIFLYVSHCNA
ncbi:unnamed protein product [Protopolystoma xenopodis]|uniref:Uncharacterized protein n=1 Tax=Protopolystoma xenopodis TaxID=117903 RepID=A0A3S5BCR7_9PLAT|nr:unnamed protein product [Protopolystoma xenopodis]